MHARKVKDPPAAGGPFLMFARARVAGGDNKNKFSVINTCDILVEEKTKYSNVHVVPREDSPKQFRNHPGSYCLRDHGIGTTVCLRLDDEAGCNPLTRQ